MMMAAVAAVTAVAEPAARECSTIVYRGQLNLLSGEAAESDEAYVKRMHFRVYDGAEDKGAAPALLDALLDRTRERWDEA